MLGIVPDARYALRSLLHRPALTAVAVATLAIGSGAATAMFAVVDSVLIEPLKYPEADEVVAIWHHAPGAPFPLEGGGMLAAASMLVTYADENRVFESIGLWTPGVATITGEGEPEEVPRVAVTLGVLETLGVPPLLGRWFDSSDGEESGRAVILSHGYWQRRFGGDRAVVGRALTLNGNAEPTPIVGVMPPGFRLADQEADLLMGPMVFDRAALTQVPFAYYGTARLKPGVTIAEANADLERMLPIWSATWPSGADAGAIADMRIAPAVRPLKDDVVGEIGDVLWLVMAAIGVVFAIACANVANLMLIRATARSHELAIRAALGAGAARLRRALRLEGVALGLVSGAIGIALAEGALGLFLAYAPPNLPRLTEVALGAKVVAGALALATFAGFVIGLVTAAKIRDVQLGAGLHAGRRTASGGRERHRVQHTLVVAQVALAVVVSISAGLVIRTVGALRAVDPGFSGAEQVQTLRISMRASQVPDPERVARRQQEIVDALAALTGVTAVGFGSSMPMDEFNILGASVEIEGRAPGAPGADTRRFKNVSPGYFGALGVPLIAGRDFSWGDLYESRAVVLVSENMARELWGTPVAALGKRLRQNEDARWREVIGVVAAVREDGLRAPAPPIVYWPALRRDVRPGSDVLLPATVARSVVVAVRSRSAGNDGFVAQVQRAVWSVDPDLPLIWVRTLKDIYDQSLARTTFVLAILSIAASAALLLGVVGLYGVLSYAVALRRREIAIRLALGESQRGVRRRFVAHGVALAALGLGVGVIAAIGVARLMTALLYGVEPVDARTYAAVAAGLLTVAALASYLPARRASSVAPLESLAAD